MPDVLVGLQKFSCQSFKGRFEIVGVKLGGDDTLDALEPVDGVGRTGVEVAG